MVAVRRFLALDCESVQGSREAVIELPQAALANVALELTLLIAGLAEALRLQPSKGPAISVTLLADDCVTKAVVTSASDGALAFALGRNQAEYLQAVLLRAYRDQMAEVNHVHIEGEQQGTAFDLTVMFAVSREPMSAEDAQKLLND